jgi:hypothetical protein
MKPPQDDAPALFVDALEASGDATTDAGELAVR